MNTLSSLKITLLSYSHAFRSFPSDLYTKNPLQGTHHLGRHLHNNN